MTLPNRTALEDYVAAVESAEAPSELWSLTIAYFASQRIDMVSYHHLPPVGADDQGQVLVVAEGFPPEWVGIYTQRRLYQVDPIPAFAKTATRPARWSEILAEMQLGPEEREYLAEARAYIHCDGLAVQVFGPAGRNGYFGLGFGADPTEHPPEQVREMQWVCQLGHLRYCEMLNEIRPNVVELSRRENEVLEWVARGKSNMDIATILGVSVHTVDAYLRRVFLKLGTSDRVTAAIRGLGSGLIHGEV
ncbi:LuxR family transcriptional regulator [Oceanomicrobium pacificus]|uniref:LuxR family transcriptional regulator n=1 Tax=Oceanomicrobium pacificus TaxID=2692916 RepID=A0A6B0U0V2_9RHOB|nr:LuxR family transcriptional regulator [Oceanomicrobium pacificus]MXU64751.1 LuxR family transcriptional regulator [Oceanomicrobium pacificus]